MSERLNFGDLTPAQRRAVVAIGDRSTGAPLSIQRETLLCLNRNGWLTYALSRNPKLTAAGRAAYAAWRAGGRG